jgi:hypothetical protein
VSATNAASALPGWADERPGPVPDDPELERLRQVLRPRFLAEAGWDPVRRLLAPPRDHPLLGLRECAVADCQAGVRERGTVLCKTCNRRFHRADVPLEAFVALPSGKTNKSLGETLCRVAGCQRPTGGSSRLCAAHARQRRTLGVTVEAFLARDDLVPKPSFGDCQVPACIRRAAGKQGLCGPHRARWWQERGQPPTVGVELAEWARRQPPIGIDHIVILKGLPERVQLELLVAMQQRSTVTMKTPMTLIRHVIRLLRNHRIPSVLDLDRLDAASLRPDIRTTIGWITTAVRRALSTQSSSAVRTSGIWPCSASAAAWTSPRSASRGCARPPRAGPPRTCPSTAAGRPRRPRG